MVDEGAIFHREQELLARLASSDRKALAELFDCHRPALWRMVQFRMDRRLTQRVDPDDVLQEAFMNAEQRLDHFLGDPTRSVFVWFRLIVEQTLVDVHRRHLMAAMRNARQEVNLEAFASADNTTASIVAGLLANFSTPSHAAIRAERHRQLEAALNQMSAIDREIIAMRHFEELPNAVVAEVLSIQPTAASNRYIRAIARLKEILQDVGFEE